MFPFEQKWRVSGELVESCANSPLAVSPVFMRFSERKVESGELLNKCPIWGNQADPFAPSLLRASCHSETANSLPENVLLSAFFRGRRVSLHFFASIFVYFADYPYFCIRIAP